MFRGRVRHVHFVGVGGVGMSGLAEILRSLEFDVSGSDMKESSTTKRLATLGLAFKGGTDDIRESPAIAIIQALVQEGCEISAYDPAAMERARTAGFSALVITVDTPVAGMRERDFRNGTAELLTGNVFAKIPFLPQVLATPRWLVSFLLDGGVPKLENVILPGQGGMPMTDVGTARRPAASRFQVETPMPPATTSVVSLEVEPEAARS